MSNEDIVQCVPSGQLRNYFVHKYFDFKKEWKEQAPHKFSYSTNYAINPLNNNYHNYYNSTQGYSHQSKNDALTSNNHYTSARYHPYYYDAVYNHTLQQASTSSQSHNNPSFESAPLVPAHQSESPTHEQNPNMDCNNYDSRAAQASVHPESDVTSIVPSPVNHFGDIPNDLYLYRNKNNETYEGSKYTKTINDMNPLRP